MSEEDTIIEDDADGEKSPSMVNRRRETQKEKIHNDSSIRELIKQRKGEKGNSQFAGHFDTIAQDIVKMGKSFGEYVAFEVLLAVEEMKAYIKKMGYTDGQESQILEQVLDIFHNHIDSAFKGPVRTMYNQQMRSMELHKHEAYPEKKGFLKKGLGVPGKIVKKSADVAVQVTTSAMPFVEKRKLNKERKL